MACPIQFVSFDDATQKFRVAPEALTLLRDIKGPIGVLSISGRARQGKSFILNQLIGQNGGFQVASTHRPCTKGLWIWSNPIFRKTETGSFHLILLDTEGVDAFDQTGQYSTQVFCLAVLLSSLFVFNQMGPIDESSLNQLSLVSELTKRVRIRTGQETRSAGELQDFTPSFVWLLRDFYLDLYDSGEEISAKDYLEIALGRVKGHGPEIEAKNKIRESIKSLFPDRDCCMLVRPVADEGSLVKLDTIPQSAMREEFRKGVQDLIKVLSSKAKPKRLGNTTITGNVLAGLTEAYVQAINEGAVPTISSAWMSVAETETRRAVEKAEQEYDNAFNFNTIPEEDHLAKEFQRCLVLAQKKFEYEAVGDEDFKRPFREKLIQSLQDRFKVFKDRCIGEASAHINALLLHASTELAQRAAVLNARQLQEHLNVFVRSYEQSTNGPLKWEKLCRFIQHQFIGVLIEKASVLETAFEEKQKLEALIKELQDQFNEAIDERNALRVQLIEANERARATEESMNVMKESSSEICSSKENTRSRDGRRHIYHEPASGSVPYDPHLSPFDVEKMTINQLKDWLMNNNHADVVIEAQREGNPRKADWVQMVLSRL